MLIVFTENITPRVRYICGFILGDLLGLRYDISDSYETAGHPAATVLNYSKLDLRNSFAVRPAGLLHQAGIDMQLEPEMKKAGEIPVLFPVDGSDIEFDIFSASFYLLSRYEEYTNPERDSYNRFPAGASTAFRNGFLDIPVINLWADILKTHLNKKFKDLEFAEKKAEWMVSYDIDNPWAHKNKSLFRLSAGLIRYLLTGRKTLAAERWNVMFRGQDDPYDSYETIFDNPGTSRIFILVGSRGRLDNHISLKNKNWRDLIRKLSERAPVGIHPSTYSSIKAGEINKEIKTLAGLTGKEIFFSRQHYLLLDIPNTYRALEKSGIREDYSMGYSDQTGFRAGTSTPFRFYDIQEERVSGVKVFPFCMMDRTLKDYLGTDPGEAKHIVEDLVGKIKRYGGIFIPIWHNESLGTAAEWKGWKSVYLYMMENIRANLEAHD